MAYPNSSDVAGGDKIRASQYNNLRSDALYPILQSFTYGETIAVNDAVYLKAADGKVYKTDADFNDERVHSFIGFAKETGNANDVKNVQFGGKVGDFSGLTIGQTYYLSGTAGAISLTPGTYAYAVGLAVSSTEIVMIRSGVIIQPSENVKQANDTEKSTNSTSWTKLKEIKVNNVYLYRIRIKFDMKVSGSTGYARIYKNGSAIGTEQSTGSTTWETFTEDLGSFSPNDLIQLYCREATTMQTVSVRNFRL